MPYLNENKNKDGIMPESDRASNGIMPERFSENANVQSSRLKMDEQDFNVEESTSSESPTILTDLISRVIASSAWIAWSSIVNSILICITVFIGTPFVNYCEKECQFMIAMSIVTIVFSLISFVEFADNFKIEFAKNKHILVIKVAMPVLYFISVIVEFVFVYSELFDQVIHATYMTAIAFLVLGLIAWGDWLYDSTHILSKKIHIIFRVVFIISAIVVMICGSIHGYAELEKAESQMTAQYVLDDGRVYEDAAIYDYEKLDLIVSDI